MPTNELRRPLSDRPRRVWVGSLALLLAVVDPAAAAPTASSEPTLTLFPAGDAPEMRVAMIGYRLAVGNAQRCARTSAVTGLLLHDLGSYEPRLRDAMQARFGLGGGFGVRGVVAGSPGAQAGLIAGEEIVALGGTPLGRLALPPLSGKASYARIEAFGDLLAARLALGPVALTVRSGASEREVTLPRTIGCAGAVALVPGSMPDAWSDARYAVVTQGLATVAGDDELAFALAHEMAHVVLGHAEEVHGPLTAIGIGGKRSRDRESAADRLGMTMMLAAGYRAQGADALLDRLASVGGPAISLTHPSVRARIAALHAVAAEFNMAVQRR